MGSPVYVVVWVGGCGRSRVRARVCVRVGRADAWAEKPRGAMAGRLAAGAAVSRRGGLPRRRAGGSVTREHRCAGLGAGREERGWTGGTGGGVHAGWARRLGGGPRPPRPAIEAGVMAGRLPIPPCPSDSHFVFGVPRRRRWKR